MFLSLCLCVTAVPLETLASETQIVENVQTTEESTEETKETESSELTEALNEGTEEAEETENSSTTEEASETEQISEETEVSVTEERDGTENTEGSSEQKTTEEASSETEQKDETEQEIEETEAVVSEETGEAESIEGSSEQTQEETTEDVSVTEYEAAAVSDDETITRVEWLQELTTAFEMSVEEANYPDNYFSDIDASSEYYYDIMLATEFGLIDIEAGNAVYPEDPATREFVAHTLNVCMGYVLEDSTYTYSESDSVTYPDDIQIAVNEGWFTLDGTNFLPENTITETEKAALIELATEMAASREIDTSYSNQYELQSDVIVVPEGTEFTLNDVNNLTIYDCPVSLASGDKFAVISGGFPVVRKVKTITVSGNETVIDAEEVSMDEAFVSLDMQGTVEGTLSEVQATMEDVELAYVVGGTAEKYWEDGIQYQTPDNLKESEISAVILEKSYEISADICKDYQIAQGTKATITWRSVM